ncbi:MAG: hypothetical protein JOY62_15215 [Acidobacteriaceae bacterium]|nr:hypothetical protein [Acidobacteriaceae bacterium]MBV9781312.1 hypothetical protein [Acidobacteriaceae bacterium]
MREVTRVRAEATTRFGRRFPLCFLAETVVVLDCGAGRALAKLAAASKANGNASLDTFLIEAFLEDKYPINVKTGQIQIIYMVSSSGDKVNSKILDELRNFKESLAKPRGMAAQNRRNNLLDVTL